MRWEYSVIIMGKYEPKMYLFMLKYVEFNFLCDNSEFLPHK